MRDNRSRLISSKEQESHDSHRTHDAGSGGTHHSGLCCESTRQCLARASPLWISPWVLRTAPCKHSCEPAALLPSSALLSAPLLPSATSSLATSCPSPSPLLWPSAARLLAPWPLVPVLIFPLLFRWPGNQARLSDATGNGAPVAPFLIVNLNCGRF